MNCISSNMFEQRQSFCKSCLVISPSCRWQVQEGIEWSGGWCYAQSWNAKEEGRLEMNSNDHTDVKYCEIGQPMLQRLWCWYCWVANLGTCMFSTRAFQVPFHQVDQGVVVLRRAESSAFLHSGKELACCPPCCLSTILELHEHMSIPC